MAGTDGGGSTGPLTIDSMTIGYSVKGIDEYEEQVKTAMLTEVCKMLDDDYEGVKNITAAFDKGWIGEARKKFDKQFEQARDNIKKDIEEEYKDFEERIDELRDNFIRQDRDMLD